MFPRKKKAVPGRGGEGGAAPLFPVMSRALLELGGWRLDALGFHYRPRMAEWVNVVSSGWGYSISDQRGSFPLMKRVSAGARACNQTRPPLEEKGCCYQRCQRFAVSAADYAGGPPSPRLAEKKRKGKKTHNLPDFRITASRHLHFSDYAFICMHKPGNLRSLGGAARVAEPSIRADRSL